MTTRQRLFVIVTVALLVVGLAYVGFGLFDPPNFSPAEEPTQIPTEERLIQPTEEGTALWPFTSKGATTEKRTLAINVLIHGDPERVRTTILDRTELGFEEMPEEEEEAEGDTYQLQIEPSNIDWDDAHGSTRHIYVETEEGGRWLSESYQLHSGDYIGTRDHVRAYDDPNGEWTALQVHDEYFDLFRLRHTVTGAQGPARMVEDEFVDEPFVEEVRREYHGLTGGRGDGWLTNVELAVLNVPLFELLFVVGIGSMVSGTSREAVVELATNCYEWSLDNRHGFGLVASLVVLVIGVRQVGIGLERLFPEITPQLFATGLYPVLAFGPLVFAAVFARNLEPGPAFGFAALGLATAFTLDMSYIGIEIVPIRLVLHRVGLLFSIGLFALGVARRSTDEPSESIDTERISLAMIGLIAWALGLAMPIVDVV